MNSSDHTSSNPVRALFSHVPEDEVFARQLEVHLAPLLRSKQIAAWFEWDISPSETRQDCLDNQLQAAEIVVLLLSADYLAGDPLRLLDGSFDAKAKRLLPVILRQCMWNGTSLRDLPILPRNEQPVADAMSVDDALFGVVQSIANIAAEIRIGVTDLAPAPPSEGATLRGPTGRR